MDNFKFGKKYLYWGITAFLVIMASISFYVILQRWNGLRTSFGAVMSLLNPFIWGFVLAYLLNPFVKLFQARLFAPLGRRMFGDYEKRVSHFGRGMSIFLALLFMVAILYALAALVLPQVYSSIEGLIMNFQTGLDNIEKWAHQWMSHFPDLEDSFNEIFDKVGLYLTNWVTNILAPEMQNIIASVSAGVVVVFKFLANVLIAIVVAVYVMFSREKFKAQFKKVAYSIFKPKKIKFITNALRVTDRAFMGFFMGKLLDSLIIGIICYFGCLIIGIRDSVLIAVIIGVTNIIPFFGPFIGAIPSALIILMTSPIQCLAFLVFILFLQQFDGNILGPKILGNATGISGFWVLFSIIIGAGILGPIGMIIGVPMFAVIYAASKSLIISRLKKRGLPWETADYEDKDYFDHDPEENDAAGEKAPEDESSREETSEEP